MSRMQIGLNVDIQRTNGRIHSAVITKIDWKSKSVTVEWSEADEIKGKEIDFDAIYELNPNLNPTTAVSKPTNNQPRNTIVSPIESKLIPPRASAVPAVSKGSLRVRSNTQRTTNGNGVHEPLPLVTHNQTAANNANSGNKSAAQTAAARRRSNVVKEVDKIKKQREERRARQAEQKAEKIELMNAVDPSNQSQWEFLSMIRDYREQLEFKPITFNDPVEFHQICVAVRKRPLNKKEIQRKDIDVITIPRKDLTIVHEPKQKVDLTRYLENQLFRFDYAFDETADNELVYKYTAKPLVQTIFEGGMATCFAYGQTGSGKTHTMGGNFNGKSQDCTKGIYALVAKDVFHLLKTKYRSDNLAVYASFFEIYSGKVFDLLNAKSKLRVLEDAKQQVQVVGLQERTVESVDDVLRLIQTGNNIRTSGVTSANNHSSRSHAVFQIILKKSNGKTLRGKFSLIDLAGNERGADTSSANRQTRMEGAEINKSLLALKECIRALGRKGAHLPFRASKLTQVLRDSFIGENSRTCMIAMISPGVLSCEHTLNTLRYADRVKELGAENPEMKNGVDDDLGINSNGLALLHNSNVDELPEDLYTFHEAISHLQDMEDEILDYHKIVIDNLPKWSQTHHKLYRMTEEVDYDVDSYAQRLEMLLDEKLDIFSKFKERLTKFRNKLTEEEMMSKKFASKTPSTTPTRTTPSRHNGVNKGSNKKNKTPKTPIGPDRFIPNRNAMNLEISHYLIVQADKNSKENDNEFANSSNANANNVTESLVGDLNNYRIMCYQDKAPLAPEGHANGLKVLYSSSKNATSTKKPNRYIPSQPERILDAPDIKNDYYLQLLDWNPSNILAVALNNEIYLWNANTGDITNLLSLDDDNYVSSVSWIEEGNYLAVGISDGNVQLWDTDKNKRLRTMTGHDVRVGSLSWNSYILTSGAKNGCIFNHDVRVANHHVGTFVGHTQEVCGLKWSPGGQYLASGGNDNTVNIWNNSINHDTESNKPLFTFTEHQAAVKALSWCPWRSSVLASGGGTADRCIRIWNCQNGANLYTIDTKSQVSSILWSKEYKELISAHGYTNNELIIWKYPGLNKVAELTGHTARILGMVMSPDGSTVVSLSADETLRFWECFQIDSERKKKAEIESCKEKSLNTMRLNIR